MLYSLVMASLGIAATLAITLAIRVWQQRRTAQPMVLALIVLMLALTWWILAYALEIASSNVTLKIIGYQAKFLGVVIVPVAWFCLAAQYTGRSAWLSRQALLGLSLLPALTTLLIWTNDSHHLMWESRRLYNAGAFSVVNSTLAGWFWVHSAYSYVLILSGTYLLFRQFAASPALYRRQLIALFIAVSAPLIANAITIFSTLVIDITPFAFVITGLALTWGLLRYHLLDLAPIARNLVIDSMTDGMIVVDAEERIVDLNSAAQQTLGKTLREVIGVPIAQVVRVLSERPELLERYRAAEMIQDELVLPTGVVLDLHIAPVVDGQGKKSGRVIVFRDITERKQTEQRIQAQNEALIQANQELALARKQAEEATRLKSEFLATISHELRTPLNSIIGYSEIQLMGIAGAMNARQIDYQQRVLESSQHLLQLINDLLDLSRIEAGRLELAARPFAIHTWLKEIVAQHQVLATEKKLRFDVILDPTLPELVVGDEQRLRQIATNLLSNAIKFTNAGFVKIDVQRRNDKTWAIVVSDSGIGIPADARDMIFDEFRQVDSSYTRQYGGTGLGLAIVRKLVKMMGGNIQLASTVGSGSTFTVTLPLVTELEPVADVSQSV